MTDEHECAVDPNAIPNAQRNNVLMLLCDSEIAGIIDSLPEILLLRVLAKCISVISANGAI